MGSLNHLLIACTPLSNDKKQYGLDGVLWVLYDQDSRIQYSLALSIGLLFSL